MRHNYAFLNFARVGLILFIVWVDIKYVLVKEKGDEFHKKVTIYIKAYIEMMRFEGIQ